MANSDWYPTTIEGERAMYRAILDNLTDVDAALQMDAAKKTRLLAMAQVFLNFDANRSHNSAAVKSLDTGFHTLMEGKRGTDPMPVAPAYQPLVLPAGDFVGMENEMREMRRYMKGLFTWTENMGDILKMNGTETAERDPDEMQPSAEIKRVEGKQIFVHTAKEGMDGIEYQWRVAEAPNWQPLMSSGEADTILEIPVAAGTAEKIEFRAIFLKKFKRVGLWSPTYNATVGG